MEGETRISIAGKPATCAQLAPYCKLPQYKKRVSQFCPKTCGDCKTCPNEFRGLSCDDLGQYQFTCSALQKRYNFTCDNCECKNDGAGCDDDPCDTWGSVYGYSCPVLEQVGYNCKGCKCAVRPPKDTGSTCDRIRAAVCSLVFLWLVCLKYRFESLCNNSLKFANPCARR